MKYFTGKRDSKKLLSTFFLASALAFTAWAGSGSVFEGQRDGPVSHHPGYGPELFMSRPHQSSNWSETWNHEMHFDDRTQITGWVNVNKNEGSMVMSVAMPGKEPIAGVTAAKRDEVIIAPDGFEIKVGPNSIRLVDDRHYKVSLGMDRIRGSITYEILCPGWGFGTGRIDWPDKKSYSGHNLPIPWARVHVELMVDGEPKTWDGYGSMNHDHTAYSPLKAPARWRGFTIYGEEFGLNITDYNPHQDMGPELVQRLVYMESDRVVFTSTSYDLSWEDWAKAEDVPFRYPEKYRLLAEGGGMSIKAELAMKNVVSKTDLFSNLPAPIRVLIARLMPNGWSYDFWCDYEIEVSGPEGVKHFTGKATGRWVGLEDEK